MFCHECRNQWYQDEFGLECPRCESEFTEMVGGLERQDAVSPSLTSPQVTDDNDPRTLDDDGGVPGDGIFEADLNPRRRRWDDDDSDLAEGDIEEHIHEGPGFRMRTVNYNAPRRGMHSARFRERPPADPGSPDAIFNRFYEMLSDIDPGIRLNRWPGDSFLFPPEDATTRRTVHFGGPIRGGSASFTITTSRGLPRPARGGGPGPGVSPLDAYENPHPPAPEQPPGTTRPVVAIISMRSGADQRPRLFTQMIGGITPPDPNRNREGGPPIQPDFATVIHQLMQSMLQPQNAVHGDAVYTQEALDRIVTALMEANPQSNAAPPASETALNNLVRKRLTAEMIGEGGKAECTICIDEINRGDEVAELPCKHWFHDTCVVMWLKQHNTCPICRNPVEGAGNNHQEAAAGSSSGAGGSGSGTRDRHRGGYGGPRGRSPSGDAAGPSTRSSRRSYNATENAERLARIRNAAGLGDGSDGPASPRRTHGDTSFDRYGADGGGRGSGGHSTGYSSRQRDSHSPPGSPLYYSGMSGYGGGSGSGSGYDNGSNRFRMTRESSRSRSMSARRAAGREAERSSSSADVGESARDAASSGHRSWFRNPFSSSRDPATGARDRDRR